MAEGEREEGGLRAGEVVGGRFRLRRLLGQGGYGSVWEAEGQDGRRLALKVEKERRRARPKPTLRMEALVLQRIPARVGPAFLGCGTLPRSGLGFLAMELVGPDLSALRRRSPHGRLAAPLVLSLAQESLEALRDLHSVGFLHRDVKASNLALRAGNRRCVLLDFGLSRQLGLWDGRARPERRAVGFRGTRTYGSVRSLLRREQGRRDDLVALLFVLLELIRGPLPWRQLRHNGELLAAKRLYPHLLSLLPGHVHLVGFQQHLFELGCQDRPDYGFLGRCLLRFSVALLAALHDHRRQPPPA